MASFSSILTKFGLPAICATKTCHAAELPVVFGNAVDNVTFTDPEWVMSETVQRFWTSFAQHADPNQAALPTDLHWPAFDAAKRSNLVIATPMRTEDIASSEECVSLWDKMGYDW